MPVFRSRVSLLLLIAGLLALPVHAQTPNQADNVVRGTASLASDGTVYVDNHEGSITVTTWDRDAVEYEARIDGPPDGATVVRVSESDRTFEIRTDYDDDKSDDGSWWGGNRNLRPVHYTLTIPATARLSIDDHESDIEVSGLQADLEIDTHEGEVRVNDQTGDVEIDSHESRMTLANVTGQLEVDTHDGVLRVDGLRGGLEMDTHDGRADVTFAALTDDVEVDTHDGEVRLVLPSDAGFRLRTDFNHDTRLDSDFDLSAIRRVSDDGDEANFDGSVNGGGPDIRLDAHDGRFEIRAQ